MRWVALLLLVPALAGCSDDGGSDEPGGQPTSDKGCIAGLVVDDRFRPIELTDNPRTEFQARGFVLLVETANELRSNENGEFEVCGLAPGQYTLRLHAEGLEAVAEKVNVLANLFNEATLLANRLSTDSGYLITTEYAVFIPCAHDAVVVGTVHGYCFYDASGDSYRPGFESDLLEHTWNITYMVTEVLTDNPGDYTVAIRGTGPTSFGGAYFAELHVRDSDYGIVVNAMNETNTEHDYRGNVEWNNTVPMETILFMDGMLADELSGINDGETFCQNDPGLPNDDVNQLIRDRTCRPFSGIGTGAGIKARFVQSLFFGEPDIPIDNYCAICPE